MNKQHEIEQLITSSLQNSYAIEVAHINPLELGADADALIYKVQSPNQKSYFIKIKRGKKDSFTNLQLLLHDTGIKEIISPIKTLDRQPQVYLNNFTLTVYPFVHGHDGFTQDLTYSQWITLGKSLKHIHLLKVSASIAQSLKREDFSPKWRNKVELIYTTIEDVISSDEIASKFLAFLKKYKPVILHLADKAKKFTNIIQEQSTDFVLCHGDIHAGNILVTNDGDLYIVDWDGAIIAPKERDLMFIGAGIGNVWNNKQEIEQFYVGYGNTKVNQNLIDYYRCDRILQDVAEYYEQLFLDNAAYKDREVGYKHFTAMFEPNGAIDIALESRLY